MTKEELFARFKEVAENPNGYVKDWKQRTGRKVFGAMPPFAPEELIYASGALPVGTWGAAVTPTDAYQYFPTFYCSILTTTLQLGIQGSFRELDAFVCGTGCDGLQDMMEDWKLAVPSIPVIECIYPQRRDLEICKQYMIDELRIAGSKMTAITGHKVTDLDLQRAMYLYNNHRAAMREFSLLAADHLDVITPRIRHDVFKSAHFMDKAEHLELVRALNSELKALPNHDFNGIRVVVTGIIFDSIEMLNMLEKNQIGIVGDDVVAESKQYETDIKNGIDLYYQLAQQLTALFSILFMAAVVYFIGSALFGRVMTLIAIPPISGGAVASMITADAATAAGHSDLAALAMLYNVVQMLFGVPVSSFFLRKYCQKAVASGAHLNYIESSKESEKFNIRFLKPIRNEFNTPNFILAKLAIVGFIATLLSGMTDNSVPATVIALVLGVIFTEIGFLERESLSKAGYYGFIMFAFMAMLIASFSALTLEKLISFLAPLIVLLAIGVAMLTLGATIMGVIFKMDWRLAAALGPCATFGYPFSQIISEDIVKGMDLPEEEYGKLLSMVMPKMVVSGFTTCTVASIFLASFIAPLIFN